MIKTISRFLDEDSVTKIRNAIEPLEWESGNMTAPTAGDRKINEQLTLYSEPAKPLLNQLINLVQGHAELGAFAQPKRLGRIQFSRYRKGMRYELHNDAALMSGAGQGKARTDISFTLFLSEPDEYEGGELVIQTPVGEMSVKCKSGEMILYDTGFPHRVNEVTGGERLVVVGWIESWVASPQGREILFDMVNAIQHENARGHSEQLRLLRKVYGQLLRLLAR